jgi:hypothetical protein
MARRPEYTVERMKCSMKQRYASERKAQLHATLCEVRRDAPPLGTYRCPFCKSWHLTSQKQRTPWR